MSFNTVNGKHCCNEREILQALKYDLGFNTVNGKHCCNAGERFNIKLELPKFQYRER